MVTLAQSDAPQGTPYYLAFTTNTWTLTRANTDTSAQRGLGIVTRPGLHGMPGRGVCLLDNGGLEVLGDEVFVPAYALWNGDYSRWFFQTPNSTTWDACQSYARQFGGNLATVTDSTLNLWLYNQYKGIGNYWIGGARPDCSSPWQWASGAPFLYTNWYPGEPNCGSGTERLVGVYAASGLWNDFVPTSALRGVVEVAGLNGLQPAAVARPVALLWRPAADQRGIHRLRLCG